MPANSRRRRSILTAGLGQLRAWMKQCFPIAAFLVITALLWEWAVVRWDVPTYLLPAPSRIVDAFRDTGPVLLAVHSRMTLLVTALGLALSVSLGVIVGAVVHLFRPVRQIVYPLLVASQTIPIIVLAPLLVIWFGYGMLPKVMLVTVACFFPVAIGVVDGLDRASREKLKLLRSMGATHRQQFFLGKVPAAAPTFFTGLRVAAAYAVMAAVVAEWMGSNAGLGVFIVRSAHSFRTDRVFAGMLLVTAFSVLGFALVGIARRLMLPWERYVADIEGGDENLSPSQVDHVASIK